MSTTLRLSLACLVGLAATGRLVFAMGRDNILPASGFLRQVNGRTRTPIRALCTSSIIGDPPLHGATRSRPRSRPGWFPEPRSA